MSEWSRKPLNEFVKFQRGFDLPKDNFVLGSTPVYGSTSILGFHNESKVKAPGVITGRSGTLGKLQYATKDFWPHNTTLWVKDFMGNDSKFTYYIMQCLDFKDLNSGGAVPTLNRNVLKSFKVDVPPLLTQKKIAKILSNYDDLIENNLKRIKLLEESARLTYEEWFLRFRIDGEKLEVDNRTGLPFGWKKNKLKNFLRFSQGIQVDVENQLVKPEDGYTRFIRIVDITQNTKDIRYVKTPNKKCLVDKKDIFMIRYGAPQVSTGYEGAIANNLFKINFTKDSEYLKYYIFYFLKQDYLKKYLLAISVSATMPAISFKSFGSIEINMPSKTIVEKFYNYAELIIKEIGCLEDQNQLLKEARDILLPRLMTGMIDVDELEVAV